MMYKKFFILFLVILFILIMVPSSFASDVNQTLSDSVDEIYFDCNAVDDQGDGSIENPYKVLRDGRILDNTVIHLANGEYNYSQLNTHSNVSFYGEDSTKTVINGHGGTFVCNSKLNLFNITFKGLNIFNQGSLKATNTIFQSSESIKIDDCGGAVYCLNSINDAYFENCTFINNSACYGGAIYSNGADLTILNCTFINNTAYNYGGAIACDGKSYKKANITIKNTIFINDSSQYDAGGAVYLKHSILNAENINASYNSANFGSVFTLLNTISKLKNFTASNNTAFYDGGVIYVMYGNLTLTSSKFINNTARNGAGLFIINTNNSLVEHNQFISNHAILYAGAIYSINSQIKNNTYSDNTAGEFSDVFDVKNPNLTAYSNNYTLYYNLNTQSQLPKYYSLIDEGQVTPVKNQDDGGNCWAFATIGALESAILKASGNSIILSEENLKNLASLYSVYGWDMPTNEGGYDEMGLGYLLSWLGPVLESDDEYSGKTVLSPVLKSILHVQNVAFLEKSSYYNLDSIKKAIMNYGGVYSGIYMVASYNSKIEAYVQCYRGTHSCDHAVVLVGWDDDFYIPNAPGKGAWIAKNSWGSNWGEEGYFYVSYFDNSCPELESEEGAFAFILNDTIKYDKNYQYDVAKTDYFLNTTKSVWYKNIFISTDMEYLAAVSTYFQKNTNWELTINVNNALKLKKSGFSNPGYYTIPLDTFIPLSVGDIFEVQFKITVDEDAGVPISEFVSLNSEYYYKNISFISYDGRNWKDLYKLEWEYPDHTYDSQVACIKAFTILNPVETTLELTVTNRNENNTSLSVKVLNQYGFHVLNGDIEFKVGDETFKVKLQNAEANITLNRTNANVSVNFSSVGFKSSNASFEISYPLINTNITLTVSDSYNPLNITAYVVDENLNPVKFGAVHFNVDNKNYTVNVLEGYATLENVNITVGRNVVYAEFRDLTYYNSSNANKSFDIEQINTTLILEVISDYCNNPVNIIAHVLDINDIPVKSGRVIFNLMDEVFIVNVTEGMASVNYTFANTGFFAFTATYVDEYAYASSYNISSLEVSKMKVNLTLSSIIDENEAVFAVSILNSTRGFEIILELNNQTFNRYKSAEGSVLVVLKDLENGSYNYLFRLQSPIYEADDLSGNFNITYIKTQIIASDSSIYYGGNYSVILKDKYGEILPDKDVFITVNGKNYKSRTNAEGFAVFSIDAGIGEFTASISFVGDDKYIISKATAKISILSTIQTTSSKYPLNSKYIAIFKDSNGKALVNKAVKIILSGKTYNLKTNSKGEAEININLSQSIYHVQLFNLQSGEYKLHFIEIVKRISENKNLKQYYGANKEFSVRVLNDTGGYSPNLKVIFVVDGKTYYANTNKNGYASLKINLKPGTYTIITKYKGFETTNNIVVKSTLITKDIKVKKSKTIKFKAKLLNSNGKILKNKKITFKFKGKTYKVKTAKNGVATLKLTKKYKPGKYTITSKYGALTVKNKIKIVK